MVRYAKSAVFALLICLVLWGCGGKPSLVVLEREEPPVVGLDYSECEYTFLEMEVEVREGGYWFDRLSFEALVLNVKQYKGCVDMLYRQIEVFCSKKGVVCRKL